LVVDHRLLVLDRRHVVERAVQPLAVVEHLDELEHGVTHLCPRRPGLPVDEFSFGHVRRVRRGLHPDYNSRPKSASGGERWERMSRSRGILAKVGEP